MTGFLTIHDAVDIETTVKRSRFIASLRQAASREEFEAALREVSSLYPSATHYCWAYRLAGKHSIEHSSDAGEPSGTAGRPILGALKRHDLQNVAAIVTRYYGGVKLGVRGLIAAYGDTAELAIETAVIIHDEPRSIIHFSCSYDACNTVFSRLTRAGVSESDIQADFGLKVTGSAAVANSALGTLCEKLDSLSASGRLTYSIED